MIAQCISTISACTSHDELDIIERFNLPVKPTLATLKKSLIREERNKTIEPVNRNNKRRVEKQKRFENLSRKKLKSSQRSEPSRILTELNVAKLSIEHDHSFFS